MTRPLTGKPGTPSAVAGTMLGRYVLIDRLGEGGGGEVFRAFDPVLDRKVAIKRLRGSDHQIAALMREARIVARLNHANVVTVHDVGIENDRTYLAMELVEGSDLAHWLRERGPSTPWRTTLRRLMDAGQGLAAAHDLGIVHGDIKPANILVGDDGRILVSDFGVARSLRMQEGATSAPGPHGAGTPRYMAPEQHDGAAADVRSDIYSFALTAWESLFGSLPWGSDATEAETMTELSEGATPRRSGPKMPALLAAKRSGVQPAGKNSRGIPSRVSASLRRGLAPRPEDRFGSMAEFLTELADDPDRRRRQWLGIAGGAVVVASLATAIGSWTTPEDLRCTGAREEFGAHWGPQARGRIDAAAEAITPQDAAQAMLRTADALAAYVETWTAMHRTNCEATMIRAEQSADDMALRLRCLHHARSEFAATMDLLSRADLEVALRAHEMVGQLPAIDRCGDLAALERDGSIPDDREQAAAVEDVREQFAPVKALERAGKYQAALEQLEPLVTRAAELEFLPLQAELGLVHGFVLERSGRTDEAEDAWRKTVEIAIEHGPATAGSRAAANLVGHLSHLNARFGEADVWASIAVSLARQAEPGGAVEAFARNRRGSLQLEQAHYDEAERDYGRALEIWERVHQGDHSDVATGLTSLGRLHSDRRQYDVAESYYQRSHAMVVRIFGEHHPEVATGSTNLGTLYQARGEYARAEASHRHALAIVESVFGPEHVQVAAVLTNIGVSENSLGRRTEAEASHRRALAIVENARGPTHIEVGRILINIGVIELMEQRHAAAEATFARSLAIFEPALDDAHPHVVTTLTNLAIAIASQGRHADAQQMFARALAIRERTLPADHPSIASTLGNLAQLEYEQGRHREAAAHFERALTIRASRGAAPKDRAFESFGLARALWALGDRNRARQLAEEARTTYVDAGEGYRDRHDEVVQWLAKRR